MRSFGRWLLWMLLAGDPEAMAAQLVHDAVQLAHRQGLDQKFGVLAELDRAAVGHAQQHAGVAGGFIARDDRPTDSNGNLVDAHLHPRRT